MGLLMIDTSLAENTSIIRKMKKNAFEAGVYEAFLESAPQFILQSSIVLRTGIICKYFEIKYYPNKGHRKMRVNNLVTNMHKSYWKKTSKGEKIGDIIY